MRSETSPYAAPTPTRIATAQSVGCEHGRRNLQGCAIQVITWLRLEIVTSPPHWIVTATSSSSSYDLFGDRFNRHESYCWFGNQGCKVWSRPVLMESRNSLKNRAEMITHQAQQACCVWATGKTLIEIQYAPARSDPDKASVQKIRCFLGRQPQRNTVPTNLCDTMRALTPPLPQP